MIFSSAGGHSGLRLGQTYEEGFRLENLIYLNNGNGVFEKYNNELIGGENSSMTQFIPFLNKKGKLGFFGTLVYEDREKNVIINF